MAKTRNAPSREILEAALQGLEAQRERLEEQINQVRAMMGRRAGGPAKTSASETDSPSKTSRGRRRKRRTLSAEARKRIAAAQKKRWAAFRKTQS